MDTLVSERVLLRMFRESDLDAYAEMCADPEVMRYLGDGATLTRAESWRNMAVVMGHWQLRGFGLWAVEERETGFLVGRVGCWRPEGWPGFEIGWTLRRAFWGRGYATEAARMALHQAFATLDQTHVISLIQPRNAPSIRVARRIGMRRERTGEVMGNPVVIYGIDRPGDDLV
jgi:RimJ/RimL family protein N-acetyltransferase